MKSVWYKNLVLILAGLVTTMPSVTNAAERIFAANFPNGDVFEITGGVRVPFATVNGGPWTGPLAGSPDGRLWIVTGAFNGSLWDITAGGDFTGATPFAQNLFSSPVNYPTGLAFDSDGTAYVSNDENCPDAQHIVAVAPDGTVSNSPDTYLSTLGLTVLNGVVYFLEGNCQSGSVPGHVLAYNPVTGLTSELATGFTPGGDHVAGSMIADPRGHLLMISRAMGVSTFGLYDIDPSVGGDFTGVDPIVPNMSFGIDFNQIAVDSGNNVYVAGDASGAVWVSTFDGVSFAEFQRFVDGVGDTESVAVVQIP